MINNFNRNIFVFDVDNTLIQWSNPLIFFVMYIAYLMTTDRTPYGGVGNIKYLYFFILISHILLSIALIPLVLISYSRAIQKQFDPHKKIAKVAFPIWLYVAVTGVLVYIMISPYY